MLLSTTYLQYYFQSHVAYFHVASNLQSTRCLEFFRAIWLFREFVPKVEEDLTGIIYNIHDTYAKTNMYQRDERDR